MIVANIFEIKAKLSEYLDAVAKGERVLICKRNRPIAELRAVAPQRVARRPLGLAKGRVTMAPSFFEPMPDDVLDAFESGPVYPKTSKADRVAERPATYGSGRPRTKRR
jgi:prevent-host-death family protein